MFTRFKDSLNSSTLLILHFFVVVFALNEHLGFSSVNNFGLLSLFIRSKKKDNQKKSTTKKKIKHWKKVVKRMKEEQRGKIN